MAEKEQSKSVDSPSGNGGEVASSRSPFPMSNLRDEIDRVFDRFMDRTWGESWPSFGPRFRTLAGWDPFKAASFASPAAGPSVFADLTETDKAYEIEMELPGMDEKDVEVNVTDDMVNIKGEKKAEKESKEKDYHLTERSYGAFRREFRVPAGVDPAKVEANFAKGVLKVSLPKTEQAQRKPRQIKVKSS